jgi:hypothetical protein
MKEYGVHGARGMHLGEEKCKVFVLKPEGRSPFGIDGRTILKWLLKKYSGREWAGFVWLRTRTIGGRLFSIMNKLAS